MKLKKKQWKRDMLFHHGDYLWLFIRRKQCLNQQFIGWSEKYETWMECKQRDNAPRLRLTSIIITDYFTWALISWEGTTKSQVG